MKCPIALQLPQRADAPAISTLTYRQFDLMIREVAHNLKEISSPIIACTPKGTILDIALFFAAWRLGKSVYPISFRLPKKDVKHRLAQTEAPLFEANRSETPLEVDSLEESQIATLIETSSGSKIACHTLAAHLHSADVAIAALDLRPDDAYCLNLPLFHISGVALMIRTFRAGAHLLLKEETSDATHLSAVSTQLYRYVRDEASFPKLKCLLIGGGPFPENLRGAPYPLFTTYGMTEAASMITLNGQLLPHLAAKIVEGEVWICGPSLYSHYFGSEPQEGEWIPTGNTGEFEQGKLLITGRRDRVFISGGEKIQPETIERTLLEIPGVVQAQVTPVDEAEFGQVPKALIHAEKEISSKEIESHLRSQLPRFMIPKIFKFAPLIDSKLAKMG